MSHSSEEVTARVIAEAEAGWDRGYADAQAHERERCALMAEREGHLWSGAPAHAFFALAQRIRNGASDD